MFFEFLSSDLTCCLAVCHAGCAKLTWLKITSGACRRLVPPPPHTSIVRAWISLKSPPLSWVSLLLTPWISLSQNSTSKGVTEMKQNVVRQKFTWGRQSRKTLAISIFKGTSETLPSLLVFAFPHSFDPQTHQRAAKISVINSGQITNSEFAFSKH